MQKEYCPGALCCSLREQGFKTPTEPKFSGSKSGGVESPSDLSLLPSASCLLPCSNDYEDASFIDVKFVIDALDIKIQKGEFLIPLDTLRRTPITKEELLVSQTRNREPSSTT